MRFFADHAGHAVVDLLEMPDGLKEEEINRWLREHGAETCGGRASEMKAIHKRLGKLSTVASGDPETCGLRSLACGQYVNGKGEMASPEFCGHVYDPEGCVA
jgi:hypothetical protein